MFLGRNRALNVTPVDGGKVMPTGMQRFLAKKGINSSEDLATRIQIGPRMAFRKVR